MNQTFSWSLLAAGLFACLLSFGHDLQSHTSWADVATPQSVGEFLIGIASAGSAVVGALGVVLKQKGPNP
jgi:hypothetical protein